mmetsp:Transcript_19197/g.30539  ORF Transcript_19197/g.30539 Transcript_19197/m.30539 type:complete len:633 (+) Transcript_19197:36-1934(+)
MADLPDKYEEEQWDPEEASLVWRMDPRTGNHAPTLEFPFQTRMQGEIEVTVRAAKDIKFARIGGGQRVLVELKLGNIKRKTNASKYSEQDNQVIWDQELEPLKITSETETLRVTLFHHSQHFKHPKMGSAYLPLSDLSSMMVTVKDSTGDEGSMVPMMTTELTQKTQELQTPTEEKPIPYFIEYPFVVDLRSEPTTDISKTNGRSIAPGTLIWVVERVEKEDKDTTSNGGKNTFLRLADNAGWLFTTHQTDGRIIARPSMQAREETAKEKQYSIIRQSQAWVEVTNTNKKAIGRILLFFKLYIDSEKEFLEGDEKKSKKKKRRKKKKDKLFGGLLADTVDSSSGEEIPKCCKELIEFLRSNGLETEGLFRVPGHHSEINSIQKAYEKGESVELKEVHDAGGVLKKFFRELKEPIIPASHLTSVLEIAESKESEAGKIEKIKFLLSTFPNINRALLAYLILFLHEISLHADTNKMGVKNLAVVWAPNLFTSTCMQFQQMFRAVELLIRNAKLIFGMVTAATATGATRSLKMKKKHKRSQSSRSYNLYSTLSLSKRNINSNNEKGGSTTTKDVALRAAEIFGSQFSSSHASPAKERKKIVAPKPREKADGEEQRTVNLHLSTSETDTLKRNNAT